MIVLFGLGTACPLESSGNEFVCRAAAMDGTILAALTVEVETLDVPVVDSTSTGKAFSWRSAAKGASSLELLLEVKTLEATEVSLGTDVVAVESLVKEFAWLL